VYGCRIGSECSVVPAKQHKMYPSDFSDVPLGGVRAGSPTLSVILGTGHGVVQRRIELFPDVSKLVGISLVRVGGGGGSLKRAACPSLPVQLAVRVCGFWRMEGNAAWVWSKPSRGGWSQDLAAPRGQGPPWNRRIAFPGFSSTHAADCAANTAVVCTPGMGIRGWVQRPPEVSKGRVAVAVEPAEDLLCDAVGNTPAEPSHSVAPPTDAWVVVGNRRLLRNEGVEVSEEAEAHTEEMEVRCGATQGAGYKSRYTRRGTQQWHTNERRNR
jgi:hypothetical protein